MPKAYAQWRVAGHRCRVALVARILRHGDGATRHPHCLGEVVTGVLLHPFATLLAKSKLLVLPVYPAAWPQAKQHPIVQRFFQFCRYFMSLDVIQKVRYRYQQTERGAAVVAASVGRAAAHIGLADWFSAMRVPLTDMLAWIREPWPDVMLRLLETFSGAPLIGPIVNRYFARYESVYSTRPSEQVRGLFERWSIKFSADYYEAKDRVEARNGPRRKVTRNE